MKSMGTRLTDYQTLKGRFFVITNFLMENLSSGKYHLSADLVSRFKKLFSPDSSKYTIS